MERIKFPNGVTIWAESGKAVSGIDKFGFSFPLVSVHGERLAGYPVQYVAWAAGHDMIEIPRRARGIALRR